MDNNTNFLILQYINNVFSFKLKFKLHMEYALWQSATRTDSSSSKHACVDVFVGEKGKIKSQTWSRWVKNKQSVTYNEEHLAEYFGGNDF